MVTELYPSLIVVNVRDLLRIPTICMAICLNCNGYMRYHPEFSMDYKYLKCGCCGFTKEVEKKYMITLKEINPNNYPLTEELEKNINELLKKINKVRIAYGIPMIVDSGYRSKEDQERIYKKINDDRKAKGLKPISVPMGSAHLYCMAVDISDKDNKLKEWIMNNLSLFEELELYMENFSATPTWVHIQTRKPASGNRFFKP